jgi:hypothetical protein
MINQSDKVELVFAYLTPEQRTEIYPAIRDTIPTMITNAASIAHILPHLSLEQSTQLLDNLNDIEACIPDCDSLCTVLTSLTQERCGPIFAQLLSLLNLTAEANPDQLQIWLNPEILLNTLNAYQYEAVLTTIKQQDLLPWYWVLESKSDIGSFDPLWQLGVFSSTKKNQHKAIAYNVILKDHLPDCIDNYEDLYSAISSFPAEQRIDIIANLGRARLTAILKRAPRGYFSHLRNEFLSAYKRIREQDQRQVFHTWRFIRCFQINRQTKLDTVDALLQQQNPSPLDRRQSAASRNGLLRQALRATESTPPSQAIY